MFIQSCEPVISFRTAKYNEKELLIVAGSGHKTGQPNSKIEDNFINLENYIKNIIQIQKSCSNGQQKIV